MNWIYLLESLPMPTEGFYYTLSMVLAGALIWVIKTYLNRTDTTLKQLVDTVAKLDKMLGIHQERHDQHDKEIGEIKEAIIIKRKK